MNVKQIGPDRDEAQETRHPRDDLRGTIPDDRHLDRERRARIYKDRGDIFGREKSRRD